MDKRKRVFKLKQANGAVRFYPYVPKKGVKCARCGDKIKCGEQHMKIASLHAKKGSLMVTVESAIICERCAISHHEWINKYQ